MKFISSVLVVVVTLGLVNYFRPLPSASPVSDFAPTVSGSTPKIAWPKKGQAAIGAIGYGVLDATPTDQSVPIASIAKIVTALTVLQQQPLALGENGPTITLNKNDVADYNHYLAEDGSAVPVRAGEKLSEYQALEAMLIPSANNIADTLARWSFGTIASYSQAANQLVKSLGMSHTEITSASGFPPSTVSTAYDLVLLGQTAMANPVIAQIVAKSSVTVPVAGVIHNTNHLLGQAGVNGIKTGNTDEAGYCYLFASKQKIGSQAVTVVGDILGAADVKTSQADALPLIKSVVHGFSITTINQNQVVGHYKLAWNTQVQAVASRDIQIISWPGKSLPASVTLQRLKASASSGTQIGTISYGPDSNQQSTPVVLENSVPGPGWTWRLLR